MVDYEFYVNSYLGCSIPQNQFSRLAAQAAAILESYERCYTVSCPGTDSRSFAICAMAECLLEHERRVRGLHAATNRYCEEPEPLARQLYRRARIYLEIYRGVS